ncbi:MAG: histone H1 [Bacteroidales bacterium]|nr:histone H1 [Bacteroidales bacterium]
MEEVAKLVADLKAQFEAFAKDADALVNANNKTAGARARKVSLEMDKLTKEFRKKSIEATK